MLGVASDGLVDACWWLVGAWLTRKQHVLRGPRLRIQVLRTLEDVQFLDLSAVVLVL